MEISYFGANCVLITAKLAKVIVDPSVPGISNDSNKADIVLLTHKQTVDNLRENQLRIDSPGEYEARGVSIKGISSRAHMDEADKHSAVIYRIDINGSRIGVIGHIYPELNDEQLETLGIVDILIVPVGGHGYTLDPEGASNIIKSIEPKIVIPTHYEDTAIKYEVPQGNLRDFLDEIGVPNIEESKYKVKDDEFPEQLTAMILTRNS